MWKKNRILFLAAFGLSLLCSACGSREYLVRPAPQVVSFNRIAVFPLDNLSGVPEAGDRIHSILVSELHNTNVVNTVEPGEVQEFILRSRIRFPSQLGLDTIREASRQLNADGIIFGSVNEYNVITTDLGPLPAISLSLRLVDASSGDIVWSSSYSLQGDFKETVFGIGRVNSLGELGQIVVEDAVEGLRVAMYPEIGKPIREPRWASPEPAKQEPLAEPILPHAPTRAELEQAESEREKAKSNVQKEWETIRGLSR
jgi:TolB-like protein